MKTCYALSAITVLVALCGCTVPQGIMRGQSPHHGPVSVVPPTHGNLATVWHPLHDEHAYVSSYHSTSGFPGYNGILHGSVGDCPPGSGHPAGVCPHGAGYGPGCPGCGSGHGCPHHYHSYSYHRPHDLVYPPANAPGGAVVYPYYTHKGPSDFFRDDPEPAY